MSTKAAVARAALSSSDDLVHGPGEAADAATLRARWIRGRLIRHYLRDSRDRQVLSIIPIPVMAALCWSAGNRIAILCWLLTGVGIAAMRFWVGWTWTLKHQQEDVDTLTVFLASVSPIYLLEAPFWGSSVLLFFNRIPDPNQLGCWLILSVLVYGPLTRLALIPSLMRWSINGLFAVMLACVLYTLAEGPTHNEINYWLVGATLLQWGLIQQIGKAVHQNQEEHYGLQYDLALKERQATEAVRTKNRFLAAATHDLRQPVTALALYADILKDNPETHRELAPKIVRATAAVSHLFDSLFDLSSLDSGEVHLRVEPVQIADVIHDLELQYAPLAAAKNIRLRVRAGRAVIQSDRMRLRRMVGNVLSNSIKYSKPGKKILLAARIQRGSVRVEVWDQGIGIPADQIEKVFDEFYKVSEGAALSTDGVGLGLSLVARLAKALKSDISLDSVSGQGTRCSMTLGNLDAAGEPSAGPVEDVGVAMMSGAMGR